MTIFPARAPITVPVMGIDERFPLNRIYCVGRNYAAHAREMGNDPDREPPFFFTKDADAYVPDGATIAYPQATSDYHHEVELVVAIGREGVNVSPTDALSLVYGYAVGFDMTRRDLQAAAKASGRPWSTAKNFPQSAPIGPIHPKVGQDFARGAITLAVDGETRQSSDVAEMIWSVPETIAYLSTLYRLLPGDLIFTGTPEGVGPVLRGQVMTGAIETLGTLTIRIER